MFPNEANSFVYWSSHCSSSFLNRTFSRINTSPSCSAFTSSCACWEVIASDFWTLFGISFWSSFAIGSSLRSSTTCPFGRPRCVRIISWTPFSRRCVIVGSDSVILVLSWTSLLPFSSASVKGTLKSTRSRIFLPFSSGICSRVFKFI